ncbi:MAG: redoxin domain-containing protein [Saprospiraceae bacterium]
MKTFYTLIFVFIGFSIFGQYDIDIKIKNYSNDTIIVGSYYANKQIVIDTVVTTKKGKFNFEGKDTLSSGVYFVLTKPNNDFIQFFVNGYDNEFEIKFDKENLADIKFKGSKDNDVFINYLSFLKDQRPKADVFRKRLTLADSLKVEDSEAEKGLNKIDEYVQEEQKKIITEHPDFITAKFLKAGIQPEIPEFEGEDKEIKIYKFYKAHYFDNLDLGDLVNLRSPYQHKRVDYFLEKLTAQDPDSITVSIDYLLNKMKPAPETYKYYLSYFLNKFAKMKIVGYDKVYVHIVDNYYAKGETPWVPEKNLKKIITNANNIRPILIGKMFPDITTYKKDETPVRIWDIESPYTIVLFWAHDCGHCTKAMPSIVKFYEEYESKGVTLVTVCTKGSKKTEACKEAIPKKNMGKFINTFDPYQRYRKKAFIPSTPKLFILDKDKMIILKDIPARELKNIIPEIIKRDNFLNKEKKEKQ